MKTLGVACAESPLLCWPPRSEVLVSMPPPPVWHRGLGVAATESPMCRGPQAPVPASCAFSGAPAAGAGAAGGRARQRHACQSSPVSEREAVTVVYARVLVKFPGSIILQCLLSVHPCSPDVGGQQLYHEFLFELDQSFRSLLVAF